MAARMAARMAALGGAAALAGGAAALDGCGRRGNAGRAVGEIEEGGGGGAWVQVEVRVGLVKVGVGELEGGGAAGRVRLVLRARRALKAPASVCFSAPSHMIVGTAATSHGARSAPGEGGGARW